MIYGDNLIAGKRSKSGQVTFTGFNPRTRQATEWVFTDATSSEIAEVAEAARLAFAETRNYSTEKRAVFLETVASEIEALGDSFLEVVDTETGLGLPRLQGERGRTTSQLRAFAAHLREGSFVGAIIDTALPKREPAPRPDIRQMQLPLGPVAVFTPNNFPLAFGVAGGDTASAFAAGCPVIVKGHPSYPATSELVAGAIATAVEKCGFPAGFFSFLQGHQIEVGQALVNQPALKAIAFTGSYRGGKSIFDAAASRPEPIPVYAEMGSINPVVLLPNAINANPEGLADALVGSVTLGSGQFCTNPGLVLVLAENADFIDLVSQKMSQKSPTVLLNEAVEKGLKASVPKMANKVTVKTGGEAVDNGSYCYANTVLQTTAQAFIADPELQHEHFGPVTLFVVCASLAEVEAAIGALTGNLTATIHAAESEFETAKNLFDLLREKVGRLLLNGFPTGVEVVHAMVHSGPFPATTAPSTTSVGMTAIYRFLRPIAFQNMPNALLPEALQDANPLDIWRIVDNQLTRNPIQR